MKHLSTVQMWIDDTIDGRVRVTILCADCEGATIDVPAAHVPTLARIFTEAVKACGYTGGGMQEIGTVQDDTDTAAIERLKAKAADDLDRRLVERATHKSPKH